MPISIHNFDRLSPSGLLKSVGTFHYFLDTGYSIRCIRYDSPAGPFTRVHLFPTARAMALGESVDYLTICFAEAENQAALEREFDRFFCRYPRVAELYKSLLGFPWYFNKADETYDAYRTQSGVLILRIITPCDKLWSPSVRLPAIKGRPEEWTKDMVVCAAHNGQFSRLVKIDKDSPNNEVSPMGGLELARLMVEARFYKEWKVTENEGALTIEGVIPGIRRDFFAMTPDFL